MNEGEPQGTPCGPELFFHMVAYLKTNVSNVKFIDGTTFVKICAKREQSELQQTADKIIEWSKKLSVY